MTKLTLVSKICIRKEEIKYLLLVPLLVNKAISWYCINGRNIFILVKSTFKILRLGRAFKKEKV